MVGRGDVRLYTCLSEKLCVCSSADHVLVKAEEGFLCGCTRPGVFPRPDQGASDSM